MPSTRPQVNVQLWNWTFFVIDSPTHATREFSSSATSCARRSWETGPLRKVASPVLLPTVAGNLELSACLFYSMKFAHLGSLIPLGVSAFNNSLLKADCSEGHALSRATSWSCNKRSQSPIISRISSWGQLKWSTFWSSSTKHWISWLPVPK